MITSNTAQKLELPKSKSR